MKNQVLLSQKIKNYSLLAGSMLASSLAVKAQVVYTDINPDKELGGVVPTSFPEITYDSLDLNNDGIFDFKITLNISGTNPNAAIPGLSFFEVIDGNFDASHNNIFTYSVEYAPIAFKMDCNDSVPLNNAFYGLNSAVFSFQNSTFKANNWNDEHDKYVGLQFNIDGQPHFGWLRLDVNTKDTIPNIIVKEYAYQATPNKKIAVCDTGVNTGIHAVTNIENAVSVFPNPSNGKCLIRFHEAMKGEIELSVRDASGREVYATYVTTSGTERELPLDLSQLSSGLYFIHLKSESNSTTVKWTKL